MNDDELVNALKEFADRAEQTPTDDYHAQRGVIVVPHYLHFALTGTAKQAATRIEQLARDNNTLRNELCERCGRYKMAHEGACDGCRWKKGE